ncbi:hypothetical protein BGX33_000767 [Mortierella sp. NVP41]|nr:hypothetical protein BGX33_000767 [Mortierella sp. NVP41]
MILTVPVQGYNAAPPLYSQFEGVFLRFQANHAIPSCFYAGRFLSTHPDATGTDKFSVDRLTFDSGGSSLDYGAGEQVVISASRFANVLFASRTLQQRIGYLDEIRVLREGRLTEFTDEIFEGLESYDESYEKTRLWIPPLKNAWGDFSRIAKRKGRLAMNRYEWRFIREESGGRCWVTGRQIKVKGFDLKGHLDRVFDTDPYSFRNCI